MFRVTEEAVDPSELTQSMSDPHAGGVVTFEGWVRNHNAGRSVDYLEYEAFESMAVAEGERIVAEAKSRFAIVDLQAVHRVGSLRVGDLAIWVGATAAHRQEAFLACRWAMDRIKEQVPVWKKEHYTGKQDAVWVNAGVDSVSGMEDPATQPHYARQVCLRELGAEGQRQLSKAHVVVIGAGGLGCPALQYLAAAGVGQITVCDGDRVDVTNLHRQILFTAQDVNRSKAHVAADRLRAMNPNVAVLPVAESATVKTLPDLISGAHVVLDCTDSFEAKYAIHDACWNAGIPLVQASVYQFEGQVTLFDKTSGGGCYRCLWPEAPAPGCVGNCAEVGVLGVTPGLLGVYQGVEALKVVLGLPDRLDTASLLVDVLTGETRRLSRQPRVDCACQQGDHSVERSAVLVPGSEARTVVAQARVIDLREANERVGAPAWIAQLDHRPRAEWPSILEQFDDRPLVLACAGGVRSRACLEELDHPDGVYAWGGPIGQLAAYLNEE